MFKVLRAQIIGLLGLNFAREGEEEAVFPLSVLLGTPGLVPQLLDKVVETKGTEKALENPQFEEFSKLMAQGGGAVQELLKGSGRPDEYTLAWWDTPEAQSMLAAVGIKKRGSDE